MKMAICDVCWYKKSVLTKAPWRSRIRSGAKSLGLDICVEHKGYLKGLTFAEAEKKIDNLYFPTNEPILTEEVDPYAD